MKEQNTYSLLTNSQDKGRAIFECAIYALVGLCMAFSDWEFISSPFVIPGQYRPTANGPSTTVEALVESSTQSAPVVARN